MERVRERERGVEGGEKLGKRRGPWMLFKGTLIKNQFIVFSFFPFDHGNYSFFFFFWGGVGVSTWKPPWMHTLVELKVNTSLSQKKEKKKKVNI